jgi:hypothetical protein
MQGDGFETIFDSLLLWLPFFLFFSQRPWEDESSETVKNRLRDILPDFTRTILSRVGRARPEGNQPRGE